MVFAVLVFSMAPVYVVNSLGWRFFPEKNKTLLGLFYTQDRENVEQISFAVNNTFVFFSAFVVIVVCTITLVVKLQNLTVWRRKTTQQTLVDNVSTKNQKVARMVLIISTLFIACFIPETFVFIAILTVPGLSIDGPNKHVLTIIAGLGLVLKCVNSSSNMFIYCAMSTKYRLVFNNMFCIIKIDSYI